MTACVPELGTPTAPFGPPQIKAQSLTAEAPIGGDRSKQSNLGFVLRILLGSNFFANKIDFPLRMKVALLLHTTHFVVNTKTARGNGKDMEICIDVSLETKGWGGVCVFFFS